MGTACASAERVPMADIRRQYEKIAAFPFVRDFFDAVPTASVVLNAQRQIVFANRAFLEFVDPGGVGEKSGDVYAAILGDRPGEAVGCIRAGLTEGGCGTTQFCQTCGAVASILNSQRTRTQDIQECRMKVGADGADESAFVLRVWSRPICVGEEWFTVFSMVDISSEKRRKVLERIFFHDVLNTAGGIKGLADVLIQPDLEGSEVHEMVGMLAESAEQLIDEISAQRTLSLAESGDLVAEPQAVQSADLLIKICHQFHSAEVAKEKSLVVNPSTESFSFVSDPVLLKRVLFNLVKNALEAVDPGETVTLGAGSDGDFVWFSVHNASVMPPEVQLQLFSRAFSTKGRGRGLGTYSIKLITERYLHGQVTFVSNAEEGTRFSVRYPRQLKTLSEGVADAG